MPSFDVVSKVDTHELTNAVDQANREISTRFDFKGTDAKFELDLADLILTLSAPSQFQLDQMADILSSKIVKRGIDLQALDYKDPILVGQIAKQTVKIQQGIDTDTAKQLVKAIKAQKLKVQAAVQGDQVRVSGKKRDDLQATIAFLREQKNKCPLQYENFRD